MFTADVLEILSVAPKVTQRKWVAEKGGDPHQSSLYLFFLYSKHYLWIMIVLFLRSISFIILFIPIFWWLDSTHIWWIHSDNINRNGIAFGSLEMRRHLQQLSSLNWNLVLLLLRGFSCDSEPLKETLRDSSPGGFIRSYTYQTLSTSPVLPLSCLSSSFVNHLMFRMTDYLIQRYPSREASAEGASQSLWGREEKSKARKGKQQTIIFLANDSITSMMKMENVIWVEGKVSIKKSKTKQ